MLSDGKAAANRMSDLIYPALSERKMEIEAFPVSAAQFAEFLKETGPLSKQDRVDLLKYMLDNAADLRERDGQDRHQAADLRRINAASQRWSRRSRPTRRRWPTSRAGKDCGREQDQGCGDEGQQGRPERPGPAPAGRRTGEACPALSRHANAAVPSLYLPEACGIDGDRAVPTVGSAAVQPEEGLRMSEWCSRD